MLLRKWNRFGLLFRPVPTENSISVKKGEVKQLREAYPSVANSVMASPAAKTATCQLLGVADRARVDRQHVYFSTIFKERQGLRRPGVRSGDAAHQSGAAPRLSPCAPAGVGFEGSNGIPHFSRMFGMPVMVTCRTLKANPVQPDAVGERPFCPESEQIERGLGRILLPQGAGVKRNRKSPNFKRDW